MTAALSTNSTYFRGKEKGSQYRIVSGGKQQKIRFH